MRARTGLLGLVLSLAAGAQAADGVLLEGRWAEVAQAHRDEPDLTRPEGKTRWDLSSVDLGAARVRRLVALDAGSSRIDLVERIEASPGLIEKRIRYRGAAEDAAARWLLPHRQDSLLSVHGVAPIELDRGTSKLDVRTRRVGLGWILLPSGPREAVLQRAWVRERDVAEDPGTLIHRWIDPRIGVVASVWGPAAADGASRTAVEGAEVLLESLQGGASTRLYLDQVDGVPCGAPPDVCRSRLAYGYDREKICSGNGNPCVDSAECGLFGGECLLPLSGITAPSFADMGALLAAGAWDFTPNDSTNDVGVIVSTFAPVDASQTCNFGQCGFDAGRQMGREDKFEQLTSTVRKTLSVTERTEPAEGPATLWLRAGARNEGNAGGLGAGESRLCYEPTQGYTEVPLWQFQSQDADGWYMELNDSWSSGTFGCEQNIFNHVCPSDCDSVTFCRIYTGACGAHSGRQFNDAVAEGPVTLPSGHVFQALVTRNVAEFCAWVNDADCSGIFPTRVRTIIYLWQVPYLGTVARLVSPQNGPADLVSFSDVAETDIKFGLFPPLSITVDGVTDDSVELSWNPGSEIGRIDGYKIYWNSLSGADAPYAFETTQPAASGTSVTIGGLSPGTEYFFTVTALSAFENPESAVENTYESLVFPMTVQSQGGGMVPIEVSTTTSCSGGAPGEVQGLTLDRLGADEIELCWQPASGCVDGYRILGASSPEMGEDFTVVVPDTGAVTCQTLSTPAATYFLVVAQGPGGEGPWGHFGR